MKNVWEMLYQSLFFNFAYCKTSHIYTLLLTYKHNLYSLKLYFKTKSALKKNILISKDIRAILCLLGVFRRTLCFE